MMLHGVMWNLLVVFCFECYYTDCVFLILAQFTFYFFFFFFKQKTAYEMRISDWSSDVCSSDLCRRSRLVGRHCPLRKARNIAPRRGRKVRSPLRRPDEIGRASCRERVCQYV